MNDVVKRCLLLLAAVVACAGSPTHGTPPHRALAHGGPTADSSAAELGTVLVSVGFDELDGERALIELFPQAAPVAVATLKELIESAYFESAQIEWAFPWVEVGVRAAAMKDVQEIDQEIDAHALGLDAALIADEGKAMDVWQFELLKADGAWKVRGQRPDRFVEWLGLWDKEHSAKFLVGRSRQEINEVLGYRYRRGLESRRALRGAVYLETESPAVASANLRVLLTDKPQLDGRVTVVGKVIDGIELFEQAALRPVVNDPGGKRSTQLAVPLPVTVQVLSGTSEGSPDA